MKIGYARVSTLEQNLEMQIEALKEAGAEKIYTDKMSAWNAKRPAFRDCMLHLCEGDTLMVWKLDRLARSGRALQNLRFNLEGRGIALQVISLNFGGAKGGMDTSTPGGKLLFDIMCMFAEFESNIISERTKSGMAIAGKKKSFGAPVKLTPDVWVRAVELAQNGLSNRKIADQLTEEFGPKKKAAADTKWEISPSTIQQKRKFLLAGAAYPYEKAENEDVIARRYAFTPEGWSRAIEMHTAGCSAKDIAEELSVNYRDISNRTVESYMPFIKEALPFPFGKSSDAKTDFKKNRTFDWEDM